MAIVPHYFTTQASSAASKKTFSAMLDILYQKGEQILLRTGCRLYLFHRAIIHS
jgi:hypothetical protein